MKYLVTYLNVPNPNKGTVWESINDNNPFKIEIIEGALHIQGDIILIKNRHGYNLLATSARNVIVNAVEETLLNSEPE